MISSRWWTTLQLLRQKNMLVAMLLGFSSGVPFLLTSKTLQLWLSYGGASNVLVGAAASIALPYTFKFLWAPALDRFSLPFLGRRRGWLLLIQILLFGSLVVLSRTDPISNLKLTFTLAFVIALFAATQDTIVDAFRRESLRDEEQGLAASVYQLGYRIAMWLTGGVALILAGLLSWNTSYLIMAFLIVVGIGTTLWADEPETPSSVPRSLKAAVVGPLVDFFSRRGAFFFLLFVLLYKVGDAMGGNMLPKYYVALNFTPEEIGIIAKTMGPISGVAGAFLGGALILRLGLFRSLFIFGILQALSTASFAALQMTGHHLPTFAAVIFFEDFSAGMGSAAFLAYMAGLTNKAFTATQFALLTSLMAVPRTVISSFMGYVVDWMGWSGYYLFCAAAAIPGLVLIVYLARLQSHPATRT